MLKKIWILFAICFILMIIISIIYGCGKFGTPSRYDYYKVCLPIQNFAICYTIGLILLFAFTIFKFIKSIFKW